MDPFVKAETKQGKQQERHFCANLLYIQMGSKLGVKCRCRSSFSSDAHDLCSLTDEKPSKNQKGKRDYIRFQVFAPQTWMMGCLISTVKEDASSEPRR